MSVEYTETKAYAEDGTELHVRRWTPVAGTPAAELLILHGYAEHGGRYRHVAHAMADAGIATTAPDLRGHGHSAGKRGYVERFSEYHSDLTTVFARLPAGKPRFVLGHSHGGLVALDWVRQAAPRISGLVLTNPYLDVAKPVSVITLLTARLLLRVAPRLGIPSGIPPEGVSRDPAVVEAYRRDPLVFSTATAGWFDQVQQAQARVRGMTSVHVPLLYIVSDKDIIVSPIAGAALGERLACSDKTVWKRPGELHEVLNELGRDQLIADVRQWIKARA